MEELVSSGDLVIVSKLQSPAASIISNSSGGTAIVLDVEISRLIGNGSSENIKMYKVLIDGKISHITLDRITKILRKKKNEKILANRFYP